MAKLHIEISPVEPRASVYVADGSEIAGSIYEQHIKDCAASGDAQPACEFVRDEIGVEFRIVRLNDKGEYENFEATAAEKEATCRAIYFESNADFSDEATAELYLIWEAANSE